ncbi:unnamed protein product [Oreochromis niloticus]|nr:unnamed protein product [Mustela putorius furo]
MDPADSSGEHDLARIQGLMKLISHTSDKKARVVGINAVEAILEGNPHFCQLPEVTSLLKELHRVRDTLQAQELADFICSRRSTSKQQQPQQTQLATMQQQQQHWGSVPVTPSRLQLDHHSPASLLATMWSEEEEQVFTSTPSPTSSIACIPSPGRKRRPRHRHSSPQPDAGTPEQPAAHRLIQLGLDHLTSASHFPGIWRDVIAVEGGPLNEVATATAFHAAGLRTCSGAATAVSTVGHLNCLVVAAAFPAVGLPTSSGAATAVSTVGHLNCFLAAAAFPTVGLQTRVVFVTGFRVGHLDCSDSCVVGPPVGLLSGLSEL